jgi:hypothetical protein
MYVTVSVPRAFRYNARLRYLYPTCPMTPTTDYPNDATGRFLDIWLHPVIFLPFVPLPRVMTHTQYSMDTDTGGYTHGGGKSSGGERHVNPEGSFITGGQCHRHSRM